MRATLICSFGALAAAAMLATVAAASHPELGTTTAKSPPILVTALQQRLAVLKTSNATLKAQLEQISPIGVTKQLQRTKAALDKYRSVDAATADGYVPASPCEMIVDAGMGIHYLSPRNVDDGKLDPLKPEVLVYAPAGDTLVLVAAEYFKVDGDQDLSTDADRPALFGRAFDGPMLGHNPQMPKHYDLHVWLWKRNPSGTFAQWNPDVSCR